MEIGNADAFRLDCLEDIHFFVLVFDEDGDVVVVGSHEESVDVEERVFASEQDDVEVRCVFYKLSC